VIVTSSPLVTVIVVALLVSAVCSRSLSVKRSEAVTDETAEALDEEDEDEDDEDDEVVVLPDVVVVAVEVVEDDVVVVVVETVPHPAKRPPVRINVPAMILIFLYLISMPPVCG
jgi:hypothetical protein